MQEVDDITDQLWIKVNNYNNALNLRLLLKRTNSKCPTYTIINLYIWNLHKCEDIKNSVSVCD